MNTRHTQIHTHDIVHFTCKVACSCLYGIDPPDDAFRQLKDAGKLDVQNGERDDDGGSDEEQEMRDEHNNPAITTIWWTTL